MFGKEKRMHNVKFIQKRFGDRSRGIVAALALLSASMLGLGLGLLLLR